MSRNVLVVAHTGRQEARDALHVAVPELRARSFSVYAVDAPDEIMNGLGIEQFVPGVGLPGVRIEDFEIVIVLGGDGTILRAAELVFGTEVPILGINLGHVGFLAESEREDLSHAVMRVANRDYGVEERRLLEVVVYRPGFAEPVRDWALNEAAVEKAEAARMLEVAIGVDNRPLSSFGCDAVVAATATGSTAHAFSAGGPIIWPDVAAKVLVPVAAHALFSRPLVVGPSVDFSIDVLARSSVGGVLVTDGRRQTVLPPGSHVVVKTASTPVVFARLAQVSFTDRLVNKFDLPVVGWRGRDERNSLVPLSQGATHEQPGTPNLTISTSPDELERTADA
ncbi:NAD kinase [Jonesiaceae bacterium BS-20]|uniref:NAD kinase n=1 Tax=Jonesiaceae bacterium BS-20 TaxID=3120821 RepID=A0AAU7DXT5_9MICO